MLCKWEELPQNMQNDAVRPYYDSLQEKKFSLLLKAIFDRVVSLLMLIGLSPIFLILAVMIKMDSPGEVFSGRNALRNMVKSSVSISFARW